MGNIDLEVKEALDLHYSTDDGLGLKKLKALAENGNADACFSLGELYYKNLLVTKDDEEAAKWFNLAAKKWDGLAQYYLGLMHLLAIDYPPEDDSLNDNAINKIRAYMWSLISVKSGLEGAEKQRDALIPIMKKEQMAEAEKLADEWIKENPKP